MDGGLSLCLGSPREWHPLSPFRHCIVYCSQQGGAFYLSYSSTATVSDSTFSKCTAVRDFLCSSLHISSQYTARQLTLTPSLVGGGQAPSTLHCAASIVLAPPLHDVAPCHSHPLLPSTPRNSTDASTTLCALNLMGWDGAGTRRICSIVHSMICHDGMDGR